MIRVRRHIVMSIIGAGLCAGATAALAADFPYGQTFQAMSLGSEPFATEALPSLSVMADGRITGSTGCNRFFGKAEFSGATLRIGDLGMTRMACFDGAGLNERRFTSALAAATGWRVDASRLILETAQGPMVLTRAP